MENVGLTNKGGNMASINEWVALNKAIKKHPEDWQKIVKSRLNKKDWLLLKELLKLKAEEK